MMPGWMVEALKGATWQDFRDETPGRLDVRMQLGGQPVVVVGWITEPDALPELLRAVADEVEALARDGG